MRISEDVRLYLRPIKFRAAPGVLTEAAACEVGSWEDHGWPGETAGDTHPHVIFRRLKQALVIHSEREADRVISSLENSADLKSDAGFAGSSFGDQESATAARHEQAFRRLIRLVKAERDSRAAEKKPQVVGSAGR